MTTIPAALASATFVPVPAGSKTPARRWRDVRLSATAAQPHLDRGGNLALRLGRDSGDLVDADLDCSEAINLADRYLPATEAEFGRQSKPRSHRIYRAAGAVKASFADPTDGAMLLELRADGRDGGVHLSLIPPSVTSEERREWCGDVVEPAVVEAAVLHRRCAWLGIACLVSRHISDSSQASRSACTS
jgi:hypothetical protein